MVRSVVVGINGSPESRAAGDWAARAAEARGLPLTVVQVREPLPDLMARAPMLGAETEQHFSERGPRATAEDLRGRHPGLKIVEEQVTGRPATALVEASEGADLLVLGSRGLGGLGGFLVGSASLGVIARTEVPVVLVRAGSTTAPRQDGPAADPAGAVVLGLDVTSPDDSVIAFAFEEADRRARPLQVVHSWNLPSFYAQRLPGGRASCEEMAREQTEALTGVLGPWRLRFPGVEVAAESRPGGAADRLVDTSREASLVVVGRRVRRSALGPHIGSVTHAVLHHAAAPVAVVAHD
ncbi:universal stress protein [Streptomyces sp. NPDC048664]|uniref:universal stress protein n=1 Tax=Streptomyces sp. NPDC048664 TaxID=3154505 RepID=UPI00342A6FEA